MYIDELMTKCEHKDETVSEGEFDSIDDIVEIHNNLNCECGYNDMTITVKVDSYIIENPDEDMLNGLLEHEEGYEILMACSGNLQHAYDVVTEWTRHEGEEEYAIYHFSNIDVHYIIESSVDWQRVFDQLAAEIEYITLEDSGIIYVK